MNLESETGKELLQNAVRFVEGLSLRRVKTLIPMLGRNIPKQLGRPALEGEDTDCRDG